MDEHTLAAILGDADDDLIALLHAATLAHPPYALRVAHEHAIHARLTGHRPSPIGALHVRREIRGGEEPVRQDAVAFGGNRARGRSGRELRRGEVWRDVPDGRCHLRGSACREH
jgi:hypothetical protein